MSSIQPIENNEQSIGVVADIGFPAPPLNNPHPFKPVKSDPSAPSYRITYPGLALCFWDNVANEVVYVNYGKHSFDAGELITQSKSPIGGNILEVTDFKWFSLWDCSMTWDGSLVSGQEVVKGSQSFPDSDNSYVTYGKMEEYYYLKLDVS